MNLRSRLGDLQEFGRLFVSLSQESTMRMLIVCFVLTILLAGCGGTHIDFHHSMKENNSFWMTVHQNEGANSKDKEIAQLYYCIAHEDGSSECKQTKIERCKDGDCQFVDVRVDVGGQTTWENSGGLLK